MYATNIEHKSNDLRKVKVDIQADTEPSTMPVNGADVSNLADDVTFDVGSSLFVVEGATAYMYGEDGEWHAAQ